MERKKKPASDESTPDLGFMEPQALMQMFAAMSSALASQRQEAADAFQEPIEDKDLGLESDIIFPYELEVGIREQQPLNIHPLFGRLFLNDKGTALGGIPKGTTITLTGPPYTGKTRAGIEMLIRTMMTGEKCGFVVAEEGFYDTTDSGRNDLHSRLIQIGMAITGLDEKSFREKYENQYVVIPAQYHLGRSWSDFVTTYRYVVEDLGATTMIVDSINSLDPSRARTVDNLNALKTYNHQSGVTCIVIGQIRDTGSPAGGEALLHVSEVSIHAYELSMTSKEMAQFWGSTYRERIMVMRATSKTCGTLSYPVRVTHDENGLIRLHEDQPSDYPVPELPK
ncbi:MAG: RAD55 family ATPase [Candidatus Hermodarchaeota archaeon]